MLTVVEVSRELGIGETTIRRMVHEGQIPHLRRGRLGTIWIPAAWVTGVLAGKVTTGATRTKV